MKNDLFTFDIPYISDRFDKADILCHLEELSMCAFYLAGDDQMGLNDLVENTLESTIDEYNPKTEYKENLNDLLDIIDGYNYFVSENKLPAPMLQLAIDDEKTSMLNESNEFKVYKVTICNGLD